MHSQKKGSWGSGTLLILTPSLTGSAQKYVPPPLEWGEIKRVAVWRQTKPNVAASKNGRKRGNKTEFCLQSAMFDKMLEYIFPCCAQNYCVSSSHIHVYDLSWFMSPFLVKCLVNGEILSTWWIYTHSFTVAASQIIEIWWTVALTILKEYLLYIISDHWVKCVTVKNESHITSSIYLHWLGSVRTGDMIEFNRLLFMLKILCCCCSLFGFNVTFNNFSVISWWCLVATGSSTLTFIVLLNWIKIRNEIL